MSFPIGKDKTGNAWNNNNSSSLPKQNYGKLEEKTRSVIKNILSAPAHHVSEPLPYFNPLGSISYTIHSDLIQKTLRQKGKDRDFHSKEFISKLGKAVCSGDLPSLDRLFSPGDPLDEIRIDKQSLVHLAVENDQLEVLKFLFKIQPSLKLNEKNEENLTPLESVIHNELKYEWFDFFIFGGVPFPKTLDKEDDYYVPTFLKKYHDQNLIDQIQEGYFSNLVITNIFTFLLERNLLETLPRIIYFLPELINIKDSKGETIFDKEPARINFFTPIHLAILKKIYLGQNPLFDQSKVEEGNKELLIVKQVASLSKPWLEIIIKDYFADHSFLNDLIGSFPNNAYLQDCLRQILKGNLLPAITYASENYWNLAQLALEFDGAPSVDESGKNLFHWAAIHGNLAFITDFSSAYYDIPDHSGLTPLLTAATYNQKEMVLFLIANSFDFRRTDSNGKSFLDLLDFRRVNLEYFIRFHLVLKEKKTSLVALLYDLKKIDLLLSIPYQSPFDIESIFTKMSPLEQTILYMVNPKLECFKSISPEEIKEIENFNFKLCDENWLKAIFRNVPLGILLKPHFIDCFQNAIKEGKLDTIRPFLDRNISPQDLTLFLFEAANGNKWEVVGWLIDNYPMLLTQTNSEGQTIIFLAIQMRNLPFIKKIIYIRNRKDLLTMEDNQKRSPLEFLLEKCPNWIEGLRFISSKKLEMAIFKKDWPATQALLKLVGERRKHDLKLYPLHYAFKHNSIDIIKRLLEEREENLQVLDENGATILHYAYPFVPSYEPAFMDHLRHIFVSLVNIKDGQGNTPLHLAIKQGRGAAILELINLRADVNIQNKRGDTPLHIAASQLLWINHIEGSNVRFLIAKGAGPSRLIKNNEGQTPLHLAAKLGYLINVKELCDPEATLAVRDNQDKTPLAHAVENHNFHLIYLLLNKEARTALIGLELEFTGKVLSKPSESDPYESIKGPFDNDFWMIQGQKIHLRLLDFCFHDVQFAYNLSKKMTNEDFLKKIDYLKTLFPESMVRWLVYEKTLRDQGYRINPAIYTPQSPIEIPKAPAYADFAYASKTITSMISRIQNENPRNLGFINRRITDVKTQLEVFLTDIEKQNLAETITGKKGTPECDQYYKNLSSLLIHIAILLSDEKCPIRRKAQAERQLKNLHPLQPSDNDDCATVILELVKSTVYCAADRAEALIISYELLTKKVQETSSLSKTQRPWDKDILLSIDQYKETVAQWVIKMQKDPNGREIHVGDEKHIGQQVRSFLKERGVKGGEFSKEDKHAKPYITKEKVEFSFDKFFSMSGLVELMDAGMNGRIGPDGKRISEFGKEKIIDWLIENFAAPEELQEIKISNQLVFALERIKDKTTPEEERSKQSKIAETLATQLGAPEILKKSPAAAYQAAVVFAEKSKTYAPEDLQHIQIANQLVAALEIIKDETTPEEERSKQSKIAETLAAQLGVPEILKKSPAAAHGAAVVFAGKTKTRIEEEFHLNDSTYEWGFEGMAKILAHPKIGALIKDNPIKEAEEKKDEEKKRDD